MDVFDTAKRSAVMAAIRDRDTKPELIVRSFLHRHGHRFRLHDKRLPGRPDLVLPSRRLAVFVHGCFWHGHRSCKKATIPKTRSDFWREKIGKNVERDLANHHRLEGLGWTAITLWECELSQGRLREFLKLVRSFPRITHKR